jgi:hypothetical protein
MSHVAAELRKAGVLWRQRKGRWYLRRTWPQHLSAKELFLGLSWGGVGVLFLLGLFSFFRHFDTVQMGTTTLGKAPLAQQILGAACMLILLVPLSLASLGIAALVVIANVLAFVPLVLDFPADRLRRGWKQVGRLSQISYLYCHYEEAGMLLYVVFKEGRRPWLVPNFWSQGDLGAAAQDLAERLHVPLRKGDQAPEPSGTAR